jgi:hypothetical protein
MAFTQFSLVRLFYYLDVLYITRESYVRESRKAGAAVVSIPRSMNSTYSMNIQCVLPEKIASWQK